MALQGDLSSFALPDVLRLLAGTGKSGRLVVDAGARGGEVLLGEGAIVAGAATAAPHAVAASDVIFELLRLEDGSFHFEEGSQAVDGPGADIETAIAEAEALVREWAEVEAVVPSMHAWIALAPELPGDDVHLTAAQWRALAAVGGGGNARDLAVALELTDLATCRQVMELAEAALVTIRPTHGYTAPEVEAHRVPDVELDSFEEFEPAPPMTELEDLVVEDRPVVMEDREDALLPEPLPGEGVAFEGEAFTGSVDGRSFGTLDAEPPAFAAESAPLDDLLSPPADLADLAGGDDVDAPEEAFIGAADADPFALDAPDDGSGSATSAEGPVGFEAEIAAELAALHQPDADALVGELADGSGADELTDGAEDGDGEAIDDERDSLLKFLSSVKH